MKEIEKNLNKIKTTLKGCGFKSDHTLEQWVMSGSLKKTKNSIHFRAPAQITHQFLKTKTKNLCCNDSNTVNLGNSIWEALI